jgi:hypothetical protein
MPWLPWDIDQPREDAPAAAFQAPAKEKANSNWIKQKPIASKIAGIFKPSSSQSPPAASNSEVPDSSGEFPQESHPQSEPSLYMNDGKNFDDSWMGQ